MAENWMEKSPALFVLPNRAFLSPALETITEEEETEDCNEKEGSYSLSLFFPSISLFCPFQNCNLLQCNNCLINGVFLFCSSFLCNCFLVNSVLEKLVEEKDEIKYQSFESLHGFSLSHSLSLCEASSHTSYFLSLTIFF